MAIVNKPNMNYGLWASNGNIETPSSDKVELGWIIEKPLNEQMNWLQNRSDRMLQYLNQRGVPEWDASTDYPINAFVNRQGSIYKALSQNTDSDPTLNTEIWEFAFVPYSDFVDYSDIVDKIQNEDGFVTHYVQKSAPVMLASCKGVSYNDSTDVSGYGFESTTPQITNNGEVMVKFGDGSDPKDVVTQEQLALAIQVFKVGSIYTTVTNENPAVTFGYGTWERFAEGKALVGFSTSISNTVPEWVKEINRVYGEYEHQLTQAELPDYPLNLNFTTGNITGNDRPATQNTSSSPSNLIISSGGGDQPHNNVQPSIVVYFWKRIS